MRAAWTLALCACTAAPLRPPLPGGDEVTIFIHGIRGSFLVTEAGERAWLSVGDVLSGGERSLALPFPGQRPAPVFGPLRPDGVMTRLTLAPLLVERDIYLGFLNFGMERLPGFLPFAYDWRVDAREAVKRLHETIEQLPAARVNLIGHSLGGLVALYYLRYGGGGAAAGLTWAGAKRVSRAVFVGAPFRGAPAFLRDLLEGAPVGSNTRLVSREAAFTFATEFQLLPWPGRYFEDDTLDAGDAETWRKNGWGVFADAALRDDPAYLAQLQRMLSAQREFREALGDAPGEPPEVRALSLVGEGHPTAARLLVRDGRVNFDGSPTEPGDGDVPAASAMPPAPLACGRLSTRAPHAAMLNDRDVQEAIARFVTAP